MKQRSRTKNGESLTKYIQSAFADDVNLRMLRPLAVIFSLVSITPAFSAKPLAQLDTSDRLIISIRDQKLMLMENGGSVAIYPVSTSKYGVGDFRGKMTTPLGYLTVAKKIGDNAPVGAVFHNRQWTGEILQPNTPGRDPVTTRIIWLSGLEPQNAQAFDRCIYIHGTPEEKTIGSPASYGCIRMKASDIAVLYDQIPVRALVQIIPDPLPKVPKARPMPTTTTLVAQNQKPASHSHPVAEAWRQNEADARTAMENFIHYYCPVCDK